MLLTAGISRGSMARTLPIRGISRPDARAAWIFPSSTSMHHPRRQGGRAGLFPIAPHEAQEDRP